MTSIKKKPLHKCNILPSDKIFFGSGGSSTIIVISNNEQAYKFFPVYFYSDDPNSNMQIERQNKSAITELAIGKNLSKNIIDKGISPHFVKFYGYNECENIQKIFKKCPSYISFLKSKITDPLCKEIYKGYPTSRVSDDYMVVSMEYCDFTSSQFLEDIAKKSVEKIEYYLDIFIFQIFYTIFATRKIYPDFSHRDLFLRNIIGIKQKPSGRYYRYTINKIIYDIPVEFFVPKIADYGRTNLNEKYHESKLIRNDPIDLFNFIYDIFDGQNLGTTSLKTLCKNSNEKQKFLVKYFNKFFNTKKILEIKENNAVFVNWNWDQIRDESFRRYIEYVNPSKIMKKYFARKFKFDPEHKIEQEFSI